MQNNSNSNSNNQNPVTNQNPATYLVHEYNPGIGEMIADSVKRLGIYVGGGLILVGASSGLAVGICAAGTGDVSQCIAPVGAGMILTSLICVASCCLLHSRSPENQIARLVPENLGDGPPLDGIVVLSGSPRASRDLSPRSSLGPGGDQRGGVNANGGGIVTGDLVFSR